jgi:hypothetical protein
VLAGQGQEPGGRADVCELEREGSGLGSEDVPRCGRDHEEADGEHGVVPGCVIIVDGGVQIERGYSA